MPTVVAQKPIVWQLDESLLKAQLAASDRLVFSYYFKPITLKPLPGNADPNSVDVLRELLKSEIGWFFLDRTRIRPAGFAVGEQIASLSLAPGEEVVLEQKTFSKRETTFEDQTEQERQIDLELSSTLTTELSEGLDREQSKNEQTGANVGGSIGGEIKGVNVNAEASYSKNITEAATQTQRRSVKDTSSATARVASKYRSSHKTTFRVASEDRFESTSRRVIKNPNPYTAIDLQYFKVLRRLELVQERYGVRLCWAVSVKDPARDLVGRIERGKRERIERALAAVVLPERPKEPVKPNKPPKVVKSAIKEADKWGFTGDMRADYDLDVPIPPGYVWDGSPDRVAELTSVWGRPPDNMGWHIVGTPWIEGPNLKVRIHVGCGSWIGGPKVFMQAAANFVAQPADDDPAYKQAYEAWKAAVAAWESQVASLLAGPRRAAEEAAEQWAAALLAQVDPADELMDQIIKQTLHGAMSDEAWEVSFWNHVFDWQRAGVTLYPSWWSTEAPRDYMRSPSNFLNASWATLYLPVKPAFERLALRWIIGKVRDAPLDAPTEAAIAALAAEIAKFRKDTFGDEAEAPIGDGSKETFQTLGKWSELLPTDGTHLEVMQAMTTTVDDQTRTRIEAAAKEQEVRTQGEEQDVLLKKKALDIAPAKTDKLVTYAVSIATENGEGARSE